jgi:hypothetical protein
VKLANTELSNLFVENQAAVLAKSAVKITTQPNNSMDVRAKQLLCLLACPLNSNGLAGGFAPRHLSRCALSFC